MTKADRLSDKLHGICKCWDCKHYRTASNRTTDYYMCMFAADGGYRPMRPIDCYKHKGTPYEPKDKGGDKIGTSNI